MCHFWFYIALNSQEASLFETEEQEQIVEAEDEEVEPEDGELDFNFSWSVRNLFGLLGPPIKKINDHAGDGVVDDSQETGYYASQTD